MTIEEIRKRIQEAEDAIAAEIEQCMLDTGIYIEEVDCVFVNTDTIGKPGRALILSRVDIRARL